MALPNTGDSEIRPDIYSRDDHGVSRQNIDSDAMKIMYRLLRNGYKAYLVGGGVRDLLLGKAPKDFDIATDATPRKVKELFRNSRIIGRRFKLVHVFFKGGKIIEVSTFRDFTDPVDPEEDEPAQPLRDNKYGTEMTDARRRDLTINGLFYDLSSFSIIDYVGGMKDLREKIVRVIGDPDDRFAEDPVRMMRVVRHAVRSGFDIESGCWDSILRNRELLRQSSQVRVYEELKKDLCSGYALPILRSLEETKLLELLLPELTEEGLLAEGHPFSQALAALDAMTRAGNGPAVTAVLSLMGMFLGAGEGPVNVDEIADRYQDSETLGQHMAECFRSLQVPRKEKERVGEIILIVSRLMHSGLSQRNRASLGRTEHLSDLLAVVKAIEAPFDREELLEAADSAKQQRRRGHDQGGSHRPHHIRPVMGGNHDRVSREMSGGQAGDENGIPSGPPSGRRRRRRSRGRRGGGSRDNAI